MKVLHILAAGDVGGIEVLCKNIIKNANWDNRICVLFKEGSIYEELKVDGYNIFSLKDCNNKVFKIAKRLSNYCVKEKIDIVTVHHGGLTINIIYILIHRLLKSKKENIKFVRYLHGSFDKYSFGNSKNKFKNYLIKYFMQKAFDISDMLIFISQAVKISFEKKFKLGNNEIVYNGIDSKFFCDIKHKNKTESLRLIYVGRLYKTKGISILISACKILKDQKVEFKLIIVGEGEEKENLEKQVIQYELEEIVSFVGKQNNVIDWLDNADIFIYPSIWEEGFGISVVEAMSRGCIPITFNRGGLPEIIDNGKNGFLVDKIDEKELAQKIKEVDQLNNEKQNEVREKAVEKARKYTIQKTINSLESIYKLVLK